MLSITQSNILATEALSRSCAPLETINILSRSPTPAPASRQKSRDGYSNVFIASTKPEAESTARQRAEPVLGYLYHSGSRKFMVARFGSYLQVIREAYSLLSYLFSAY